LALLAWSFVGILLTWRTNPVIDRTHFSRFESRALIGAVADEPVERGTHIRFPLIVTRVYGDGGIRNASGMLMLGGQAGDRPIAEHLSYGDELLIPSDYEIVPPPYNPGELDYQGYLAGKHIWHQDYLEVGQIKKLAEGRGNPVVAYALELRQRMVAKFAAY